MAILNHCIECDKLIHPSFGLYCSVECNEVFEAVALLKQEGQWATPQWIKDAARYAIEDLSTLEDRKSGIIRARVKVQAPPITFIKLDMEISI